MLNLLKKYLWLTIGLAAALVLLLAVGARLFFVVKSHQKEQRELNAARDTRNGFYNAPVFPSQENIKRETVKRADMKDYYNEIYSRMASDQVFPEAMESSVFRTFLENTLSRIWERLQIGRVAFPEKYAFGFEKYVKGESPLSKNIPRLVQQLKMMEKICELLPDAAVTNLMSFSRDEFEGAAGAAKTPPGSAGAAGPSESLYSTQHFKISFQAPEGSVFDFLNRLARLPMFTVVTRLEITNPKTATSLGPAPAAPATTNMTEKLPRDKRIILGREEVEAKLEMDIYNFSPSPDLKNRKSNK